MNFNDIKKQNQPIIITPSERGIAKVTNISYQVFNNISEISSTDNPDNVLEFAYFETGIQKYIIKNKPYFLRGGELLIVLPHEKYKTGNILPRKSSFFKIQIQLPKENEQMLNLTSEESKLLIDKLMNIEQRKFQGNTEIKEILRNMFVAYYNLPPVFGRITMNNLMLSFLLRVIDFGNKTVNIRKSDNIEETIEYVKNNICSEIYIEDLAQIAQLSVSRFKHKFKEEVGIPPNQFIIRKKIEYAKEQLKNTNAPVSHIAYDLGFSSVSYFSQVFKQYVGISPTKYSKGVSSSSLEKEK